MARKKRIEFPGVFYHVLARGNNKQVIFRDEQDYLVYIERLKRYHNRYKFCLYAYTLMPNHLHLLIETGITPLSKIMQGIQQSYTYYSHKKYKSVGHLFQGRYKAIICDRDSYLLELVRYIHLNPVRASLVRNSDDYPWSSHPVYIGQLNQSFVEKKFIFRIFSENESEAESKYRQFIRDGMDKVHRDEFYNVVNQLYLGSPEFVERIEKRMKSRVQKEIQKQEKNLKSSQNRGQMLAKKKSLPEILKMVSEITKVSPESILGDSRERLVSDARSMFVFVAARKGGIRNNSLADFLKKSLPTISYMICKIDDKINNDRAISDYLDEILKVLKA